MRKLLLLMFVLLFVGCGSDDNTINVAGNYTATYTYEFTGYSPYQVKGVTAVLNQDGTNITGQLTDGTVYYSLSGYISGNNISIGATTTYCSDKATIQGVYADGVINFSGTGNSGSDCGAIYGDYTIYGTLTRI